MPTISELANAMFGVEGVNPRFIANNNPGNLKYAGQAGATLGAGGFAKFATPEAGIKAAQDQIALDLSRGTDITGKPTTTLAELINSWAPSSDGNNPASYTQTVAGKTGLDPNGDLASQLGFHRGKVPGRG